MCRFQLKHMNREETGMFFRSSCPEVLSLCEGNPFSDAIPRPGGRERPSLHAGDQARRADGARSGGSGDLLRGWGLRWSTGVSGGRLTQQS